jgi:hypothetical protein
MQGCEELFERDRHKEPVPAGIVVNWLAPRWKMPNCQIEYLSSDSDVRTPCGEPAVAKCADCGTSIVLIASWSAVGSFCELCYDYHVGHSCVREPVQNVRQSFPAAFGSLPTKAS